MIQSDLTYIFDYTRNKLIYPDDLKMLIKINKLAFDFFYTLKPEQKKYVNIVYDIPHDKSGKTKSGILHKRNAVFMAKTKCD